MTPNHERFNELISDPGWRAALHILTCPCFNPNDARIWAHVDFEHGDLWFNRIVGENRTWSSTEALMLEAAWSLFNGQDGLRAGDQRVSLYDLAARLDNRQMQTILDAILVFRSRSYIPKAGLFHARTVTA